MQHRHPLSNLIALAVLGAMLDPALAKAPKAPAEAPADHPTAVNQTENDKGSSDAVAFLDSLMASVPSQIHIDQCCAIPTDIAQRAGMYDAGFDPHSLQGRTTVLLAAALANVRELSALCNPKNKAMCQMVDQNIGAAVAALGLVHCPSPV